jgi:hypothetical protein
MMTLTPSLTARQACERLAAAIKPATVHITHGALPNLKRLLEGVARANH